MNLRATRDWKNDSVENIERLFASDIECCTARDENLINDRARSVSEPDIGYSANYDDLCGPWSFRDNPIHACNIPSSTPRLCAWKLIDAENMRRVKSCLADEVAIKRIIDDRLKDRVQLSANGKRIFLELAWSVIKFARENRFTEECTSALVGIFHATYSFFLSDSWRTARDTYTFFYRTILLHTVENPPKSIEIFTPEECKMSIDFFTTTLLRHLPLVRFVSLANYRFVVSNGSS